MQPKRWKLESEAHSQKQWKQQPLETDITSNNDDNVPQSNTNSTANNNGSNQTSETDPDITGNNDDNIPQSNTNSTSQ